MKKKSEIGCLMGANEPPEADMSPFCCCNLFYIFNVSSQFWIKVMSRVYFYTSKCICHEISNKY